MNSKSMTLLKTMLLSTSSMNVIKYSKDKKKRRKARGAIIGKVFLYTYLIGLMILMSVGYGMQGLGAQIPALCILAVSAMAFIFTIFRTNGYLFNFKEFDMLVSMPFEIKSIVACKFLYMYIKCFSWYFCISAGMLVTYGIFQRPSLYIYPMWLVLTFVLPLIPTVVASLLGALIAKAGSGFKYKKAVTAVLTFAFIFVAMSAQYVVQYFAEEEEIVDYLAVIADKIAQMEKFYWPMLWFDRAIVEGSFIDALILLLISVLVFAAFYTLVAKFYIELNSRLSAHEKSGRTKSVDYKKRSVYSTIAFKELRRMLGSNTYLTQAGFGFVFIAVISVVVLFVDGQTVVDFILHGAPVDAKMLIAAIPFMIFFFTGMVSTTAITPSLEGKNNWILQTMPVTAATINKGKMLFNAWLQIPFSVLGVVCFGICFRVSILEMLLLVLAIVGMCFFSTTYGMFCGIKFVKLEWENEIEVVKQGMAVTVYLLPNMFVTMGLLVGVVFLALVIDVKLVILAVAAIYWLIGLLFYKLVSSV